jgi:membrane associated rhomboid family serine protease
MIIFIFLSSRIEQKIGSDRIVFYYLFFGVISALVHLLINPNSPPLVGASGSVWGFLVLNILISVRISIISILNRIFLTSLIILEIYSAFNIEQGNVAHWCHLGGAFAGLLIWIFDTKKLTILT